MKRVVKMPLRRPPQRLRPPIATLKARAATAEDYDEEDYSTEEEPNMKFTHALIVVLILHVITIAAIFAFNSVKARQAAELRAANKPAPPAIFEAAGTESPAPAPAPSTTIAATTAPAAAATQPKPSAAKPTGKTHTVQAGDTLTRIASLYGVSIDALSKQNGLTALSILSVGQVLTLPEGGAAEPKPAKTDVKTAAAATTKAPAKSTEAATTTASGDIHVVAKGENPYSIAKKLHVSYEELLKINNIQDPKKIQIGQKLKIPAPKTP